VVAPHRGNRAILETNLADELSSRPLDYDRRRCVHASPTARNCSRLLIQPLA
jgi:hypothetical protein